MKYLVIRKEKAHQHIVCSNCGDVMYNDFWELMEDCNYNFEVNNEKYVEIISELKSNIVVNVGDYDLKLVSDDDKLLDLALSDLNSDDEI